MQSFTLASVLALLAAAAAGAQVDAVDSTLDKIRGDVQQALDDAAAEDPMDTKFLRDVEVPQTGSLKVTQDGRVQYHIAMGEEYGEDSRGRYSQYACGVEYTGTGTEFSFDLQDSSSDLNTYSLQVKGNVLSPRPVNWYFGAHRYYPRDSFGDKAHSLRVMAHSDPRKQSFWSFVENPSIPGTTMLMLERNLDWTARDVKGWYLAISDSAKAERDCISTYLTVTDDQSKAAVVEIIS